MGNRPKLIYTDGVLYSYPTYEAQYRFTVLEETIVPEEYTVLLKTDEGSVRITEDEDGIWLSGGSEPVCLGSGKLCLPSFDGHPYRNLLRILHHEICINIIGGQPVPNYFVYPKAWYRDGAMMAMVLEATGNLHLISDWAAGLDDLYDRNNKGNEESDNLGQLLYILAVTGHRDHPLIPAAVEEAERRLENGVLTGSTDYSEHPVYQTKWLKYGMESLGMDTSHLRIPDVPDSYNSIFWMDGHTEEPAEHGYNWKYPYLSWAKIHTMRQKPDDKYLHCAYPISSETRASEADYEKLRPLFPEYADNRCAAPHTWHAAEMFLYLTDLYGKGDN